MNYGMLSLASIALGLVGWAIPIIQLSRLVKGKKGLGRYAHTLSMGACCLAIWFQICYDEHLVDIGDWSALMDTIGAVRKVSMFLLIVTLLINLLAAYAEGAMDREIKEGQDPTV